MGCTQSAEPHTIGTNDASTGNATSLVSSTTISTSHTSNSLKKQCEDGESMTAFSKHSIKPTGAIPNPLAQPSLTLGPSMSSKTPTSVAAVPTPPNPPSRSSSGNVNNASTNSSGNREGWKTRSVLVSTPAWMASEPAHCPAPLPTLHKLNSNNPPHLEALTPDLPHSHSLDSGGMLDSPTSDGNLMSSRRRPAEEDLLSDISSVDDGSSFNSSLAVGSWVMGSRMGRKGDEIEQERNRLPANIDEDLFVYDDIIISKDEARTKHWRLAGRKGTFPSLTDDLMKQRNKKETTFSFNDFDVCVDEMDVAPSSTASSNAVKALLASMDNSKTDTAPNTPGSPGGGGAEGEETSYSNESEFGSMCLQRRVNDSMSVTWTSRPKVEATPRQRFDASRYRHIESRSLRKFTCQTLRGHATRVKCLSISPSERDYVSCSNEDASVVMSSFSVGDEVGIFTSHVETVICTAFSPDGKLLATTSKDRTMKMWDAMTTKLLLTFNHMKVVICCCFGPDSRYLVSGCQDKVCRLWDTRRGKEWLTYSQHEGIIISVAFSPDGNYVCSASADSTLRVWTSTAAKTKFTLIGHKGIILSCSYTADGAYIVSNDESQVRVWSTADGSCQLSLTPEMVIGSSTFTTPYGQQRAGWTLSAAGPGGFVNYILVACNNRFVYVIDRRTGEEVVSSFCKAPVYCLSTGWEELVACGDSFGNVYILRLT